MSESDSKRPNGRKPLLLLIAALGVGLPALLSLKDLQFAYRQLTGTLDNEQVAVLDRIRNNLDLLPDKATRWGRYRDRYGYRPPKPRGGPVPSELCGEPPDFAKYFQQKPLNGNMQPHRSVNNEDGTIYNLFRKEIHKLGRNGTYVELGAFDGITESNSRFFDECLGWEGLLIEGNPRKYDQLVLNRPHAHKMSFAPSCSIQDELENATVKFHAMVFTNAGLEGHALGYPEGKNVVPVPCGSLTPVLMDVFGGHVDFFSLDVEGSEPLILENIDFDQVFIEILMVESWNFFCQRDAECESRDRARARMNEAGYKRFSSAVQKSDLYIHPRSNLQMPSTFQADIVDKAVH